MDDPEITENAESVQNAAKFDADTAETVENLIDPLKLKQIIEAALLASDEPLTVDRLTRLFAHHELDSEAGRAQIRATLEQLQAEAEGRGYELQRVASGYRYQVRQELAEWVARLWVEKPPRYSRALLETLALVAYKQPVTRGDIEALRGVAVSQSIMRTLLERDWVRVVGQREVPGRPSLYGTTKAFLDYFNLQSLDTLPPLPEIRALIEHLVVEEVIPEAATRGKVFIEIDLDEADRDISALATEATKGDLDVTGDGDEFGDAAEIDDEIDSVGETAPRDAADGAQASPDDEAAPRLADVVVLPQPSRL